MRERPILLDGASVRAILDGRKTQERRIAKEFAGRDDLDAILRRYPNQNGCPFGEAGDSLWVRETWRHREIGEAGHADGRGGFVYRATETVGGLAERWNPGTRMPRRLSRITLEIESVRVERLQDISEADARAEGARYHDGHGIGHSGWRHDYGAVHADARSAYARRWNEINGAASWGSNPWTWVLTFRRIDA